MKIIDRLIGFFASHERFGMRVTVTASLCILSVMTGVVGVSAYWYITANPAPPLTTGALVMGASKSIRAGEEAFAYIPMKWDTRRRCSARVQLLIQGENGEVYPSPPTIDLPKEAVDESLKIQRDRYEFYVVMPAIARPGTAYLTGVGTYYCDDNRAFGGAPIQLVYKDSFTILPRKKR